MTNRMTFTERVLCAGSIVFICTVSIVCALIDYRDDKCWDEAVKKQEAKELVRARDFLRDSTQIAAVASYSFDRDTCSFIGGQHDTVEYYDDKGRYHMESKGGAGVGKTELIIR